MTADTHAELDALEEQLRLHPESERLRETLLFAFLRERLEDDPRRIEHILEYVRRFPRNSLARSPLVPGKKTQRHGGTRELRQALLRVQGADR